MPPLSSPAIMQTEERIKKQAGQHTLLDLLYNFTIPAKGHSSLSEHPLIQLKTAIVRYFDGVEASQPPLSRYLPVKPHPVQAQSVQRRLPSQRES